MPLYILLQDLKWNPHIHCLISELIYSFKKDKIKTFQFERIRLIQEAGELKKPEERTDSIKITLKDSMSMPSSNPLTMIPKIVKIFKAG